VNEKKELDLKDHKVIRDLLKLKEKVIRVRKRKDGSEDDSNINKKFLLPDGSLISIDAKMIYEPMEMMFNDTTDVNSLSNENGGSKSIKKMI
jgi:hypothetical protein